MPLSFRQFNGRVSFPSRSHKRPLCLELLEERTLLNAGVLDPTFGTGGIVTTSFPPNTSASAAAAAIQPDGKIVVAGEVTAGSSASVVVVRYNPDGSLDQSFGTGGEIFTPTSTALVGARPDLALQTDGKILVADGLNLLRFFPMVALI